MDRSTIDVVSGGALVEKTTNEAKKKKKIDLQNGKKFSIIWPKNGWFTQKGK